MAYRGQGQKVQKVMVQPINLIFRYLQNVRVFCGGWGCGFGLFLGFLCFGCFLGCFWGLTGAVLLLQGFDEYMNLVLDDAEEIHSKTKSRKQLGRIMLKGDNITLLQSVSS
ncbi:small nuclear ribonucleoprotein E [Passer montanus]|uniref:small nuclear ribonucleoprotein E n=1 Tax=Passer montanus TaxID=9160 RepID=UPI00196085B6|nr:small nuclear ribonucleoprotein E [Passer montanus]